MVKLPPGDLDLFAGQYLLERQGQDLILEFSLKGNHLQTIQKWDGLSYEIYPEEENKFFKTDDGTTFLFKKDDEGAAMEVFIDIGYQTFNFSKIH